MATEPKFYKGKRPKKVSVRTIFKAVQEMSMHASVKDFIEECERRDLKVSVDADLVNLVKDILHKNEAHTFSANAASIVDSDTC